MSAPIKAKHDRFSSQSFVHFDANAGTLFVRESDRSTSFARWRLTPPESADWDLLAHALSGRRIVAGALAPIPAAELLALREQARLKHPDSFGTPVLSAKDVRVQRDDGRLKRLLAIVRDAAESAERRQQAVEQVGALGNADALPALIELLRSDAAVNIRAAAAMAVGRINVPRPEAIVALAKVLREEKNVRLRQVAVQALQTDVLATATSASLMEALRMDTDPYVRGHSARALRAIATPDDDVRRALRDALTDATGWVRVEAAAALITFDPNAEEPAKVLVAAVQGADEIAQSVALKHVGRLGDKARPAVPALAAMVAKGKIQQHFREPTWYALRAITQLGPIADDAIVVLISKLGDDDSDPRTTDTATGYVRSDRCPITFALAHIGPAALPELKRVIESSDEARPRLQAALAIGFMGPRASSALPDLERLQQRLADPRPRPRTGDDDLRAAVDLAIANIRRPNAGPPSLPAERE